jgi:hypothetical protein
LRVLEYLRVRKLSVIDDDRLASLIAERDKLRQRLDEVNGVNGLAIGYEKTVRELRAERDKLKAWNKEIAAVANANIERVSVLEAALRAAEPIVREQASNENPSRYNNPTDPNFSPLRSASAQIRAALRTSEDAK